ncbi:MAG: hypothetical protein HFH86_03605 [Bacilli bacterium]|jgi:hypothetical protein|nr:hypothetical protein [Bacilli bacterium]
MELKSYHESRKKQKIILGLSIVSFLFLVGMILYRSFALYDQKESFDVIKGSIPSFLSNYDVKVSVLVDGVSTEVIPGKESGKAVEKINCTNETIGTWDYQNWNLIVKNLNHTRTKCEISFQSKYTESILNGTDPELKDGLIPVIIASNGEVKKASLGSEWYNYGKKRWANAVILLDESVAYGEGEVIPESNIESYFVWIPRYRYQLFNMGEYDTYKRGEVVNMYEEKSQIIAIEFENNGTNESDGNTVGSWLTHPAFRAFDTNGIWVGKFETGYQGFTDQSSSERDEVDVGKVQIKPNVYSWRNISFLNMHLNSYNYKREYNSHMMKNTEWGAIAYLSHSQYGIGKQIRVNNTYFTGNVSKYEPDDDPFTNDMYENNESVLYNTDIGYLGSTTGNISGIYGMSGGAGDVMMAFMKTEDSKGILTLQTGFKGFKCIDGNSSICELQEMMGMELPNASYYDLYDYNGKNAQNEQAYRRRILGDATGELGPFYNPPVLGSLYQRSSWYHSRFRFLTTYSLTFVRGGFSNGGSSASQFTSDLASALGVPWEGYRITLAF